MESNACQSTETPEEASSTTGQDALVVEQAGGSESPLIASRQQSSLVYAAALVVGGGSTRAHLPHAQGHGLSLPYQPCSSTQKTGSASFANHSTFKLKKPLPPSLEYARRTANLPHPPYPTHPCHFPAGVGPTLTEVVGRAKDQNQDLRTLAQWPRLHDSTLPSPIVGDIESDPHGVSDRYGVKGKSIFTSFINTDDFSCRLCAFKANTLELAILHQQRQRHFQP